MSDPVAVQIVLLMGVSGVGKSTIGRALAMDRGWPFYDADDYHPPHNIRQMAAGIPLTDADREPWLATIGQHIAATLAAGQTAVWACSALREQYRQQLHTADPRVLLVYLHGSAVLLQERLAGRTAHFMPPALLQSQLQTLEPPPHALAVDVAQGVGACVAAVVHQLDQSNPQHGNSPWRI